MTPGRPRIAQTLRRASAIHQPVRAAALFGVFALCSSLAVHAEPPVDGGAYKLAPGDRITVTVFGQTELSGDILVDGTGNILLPFIGPIAVENLTTVECQKLIVDRLSDGLLKEPLVSVRISELRPLYVVGLVRAPGAYPFRYSSTVKSAVAAAGGYGPAGPLQNAAISEFLLADERVRQLTSQRTTLVIRLARLEAQRDGIDSFSPPSSLGAAEEREVAEVVAAEKETFASQAAILKNQLDLLRPQKPRLQKEIEALTAQMATEKKLIEVIRQHADQYSGLVKQGLGLANAELQFQLSQASHESELWRVTAALSRLQMESGELDIKIQEVETSFKKQVMVELREVQEGLRNLDVTLPSAREIREVKRQEAGGLGDAEPAHLISVTRARNGEVAVFQANEATALEPGDIVDVQKLLPNETPHRSASAR